VRARLLAWLLALAGGHIAAAAPLSVGIAAPPDCAEIADLLMAELTTNPELQLLDRSAFPDLRRERVLPGSGMGAGEPLPQSLLQADVILRLQKDGSSVKVQAASVRSGIVLQTQSYPWPADAARQLVAARLIAADCQHAWSKAHTPHEQLRIVSLPRIVSINAAKGDAAFGNALNYLLRERLQRNPRLVVVERLKLGELAIEREGRELPQLAQAAHVFGGTIDEFVQGPDGPVRIDMRHQTADTAEEFMWLHGRRDAIEKLVANIATWMESKADASAGAASGAEPQQILQRAKWSRDILLHEQTLELVGVFHLLTQPNSESRELQFAAGIEHFTANRALRNVDADKLIPAAVEFAAFLRRELVELARTTRAHTFKVRVVSAFGSLGSIARWDGARQPLTEPQQEALRSLRAQLDRLAEAVQTLDLPNESRELITRAAYAYRLQTSSSWSDFQAVYREAAAKGVFVDRPEALFRIGNREWTQLLESIYRTAPGAAERFAVGAIWCRYEEDPARRTALYEELSELIWQQRDAFLAEPRFAAFKQIRELQSLTTKHRDLQNVQLPFITRTIAYVLENATAPIVRFDANNYREHLKSAEAAALLREAAQKSEQRFAGNAEHAASMRALLKEIDALHPQLPIEAPAPTVQQPLNSTWFWNLYAAAPRARDRKYQDTVLGIYVHASELWCTNGYAFYRIGLDGRGRENLPVPHELHRRPDGLPPERMHSVAVSDRFIIGGGPDEARYVYYIHDRARGTWRKVQSPFGSGQAAEHQSFSELVFAGTRVLRPAQIRSSSAANVFAIEVLNPETGELFYPVRGDRTPPESPIDVPGNYFQIAGAGADGAIWIVPQRRGGSDKAAAHAWHPTTGKWRPLTAAETQLATEKTLPLATITTGAAGGELTQVFKEVRLLSRTAEAAPLRLLVSSNGKTVDVPLQLSVPERELEALRSMYSGATRGSRDVLGDMLAGRQARGRWIPEGLIVTAHPVLGVFFFDRESIAASLQAAVQQ
jgi:hypothetical protein